MKIKIIFIISGVLSFLSASAVSSIFEFFVIDGFGEGILKNKEAVSVFENLYFGDELYGCGYCPYLLP